MRRVLITAGASGIGRAMAEAFDAAQYQIWVTDIDEGALDTCPTHWQRTSLDVADEDAMHALFQHVDADWGGLDAICANAGIAGPTAKIEDISQSEWQRCLAVNLEGAYLTARFGGSLLRKGENAGIVLTSSTAGQYGYPNRAPYAAAKWAVIGLGKTLAMEWGPEKIRSNVICPGSVEGPRMEHVLQHEAKIKGMTRDEVYNGYAKGTSMQSFVKASDIADTAVFLSSPNARMISGQVIAVDGHTVNPDPQV